MNQKAPEPLAGRNRLRVGRLTKPHGLKGGLKLELFTDAPELRFTPGARFALQVPPESEWFQKELTVSRLSWMNGVPVGFFDEVADRTAAESIAKAILWLDLDTVDDPVEPDAWYDHQLVGLQVRVAGATVGTIAHLQHMPAQDLLVVTTSAGDVLVPFVSAIVPEVNVAEGYVVATPPPGLFDEGESVVVHPAPGSDHRASESS